MWHVIDNRLSKRYDEATRLAAQDQYEAALAAYRDLVSRSAMAAERGLPVTGQFIGMALLGVTRSLQALGRDAEAEASFREIVPYLRDLDAASSLTA
ncbi:MAG: hypothetical protein FJZ01_10120 [Candidatus Sericytochromatia bacterium]|nr:hypothetical protein [Candidatus Tanganyikabacteria bacterium]